MLLAPPRGPLLLDAPPSARRLRRGRPTFLCALHSLVHSCRISTRTRLRSLPPSLAFSLSCTHASHALPLTQACPSPETPQVHTDRRQRSRWASNAESWCRGGHRQFACMSQVTTWAWLLLQVEHDEAGAQRAGTRRATRLSVLRASRDTAKGRHRGVEEGHRHFACKQVTGHDVGVAATFACISDVATWGRGTAMKGRERRKPLSVSSDDRHPASRSVLACNILSGLPHYFRIGRAALPVL